MVISGKAKDVLYSQKELLLRQFVLLGSGWWRISWDIFMTLVVIISVILTPYRIAFDQARRQLQCSQLISCLTAFCCCRAMISSILHGYWRPCSTAASSWTLLPTSARPIQAPQRR